MHFMPVTLLKNLIKRARPDRSPDVRGRRFVAVIDCILNQNARDAGAAQFPAINFELLQLCHEHHVGILQMPCPEIAALGFKRVRPPGQSIRDALDTESGRQRCSEIAMGVADRIEAGLAEGDVLLAVLGGNRAAGALRVSAKDGQQHVAFGKTGLDSIRDVHRDFCATLPSGFGVEGLANRLSRQTHPFETKRGNFRAWHLENAHVVFMTKLQQREIHRRKPGRTRVAVVLVEDAVDDGDKATSSDVWTAIRSGVLDQVLQESYGHEVHLLAESYSLWHREKTIGFSRPGPYPSIDA